MMARISVAQVFVALAVLAVAYAQTTTTIIRGGVTVIAEIDTDTDGLPTATIPITTITPDATATRLAITSSASSSLSTTSTLDDEEALPTDEISSSSSSTRLLAVPTLSSSASSSRHSSSTSTLDDTETVTDDIVTSSTSRTTKAAVPTNANPVDVPAGTIMGVDEYSSMVSARQQSRNAEYTATGGKPLATGAGGNGAGAIEVSAMMVAMGVMAAAVF